mgnify:CR=1 FL=1
MNDVNAGPAAAPNVTLKHLKAFVAVANEGSFTRAAARMTVSQPALTIQVNQFEEELGVRLFDRTTRRVQLTESGATFLPTAERLLEDVESAVADIRDLAERRRGRVGVATLPSVAARLMPRVVTAFRETYPGVSVHLHDSNARGVQELVRRKEVDFGLGSVWEPDHDLTFETVLRDPFHVVFRHDHPLAQDEGAVRWPELAGHEIVGLGADTGIRPLLQRVETLPENVRHPRVEVSNTPTLEGMLVSGLGITVLPRLAVPSRGEGTLISRPMIDPELTRDLCVISRSGRSLTPAAQSMRDLLLTELADPATAAGRGAAASEDDDAPEAAES